MHIYISGDFIATVHQKACPALAALHESLSNEPTHDEEMLIYRVLDGLTDAFYPVIARLEDQIDTLEVEVLQRPRREHLTRSYRLKQDVRELHRLTLAQFEQFKTAHEMILGLEGLTKGSRPYLRDIGDHLAQISSEFQRQLDDLLALDADLLQRQLRPAERGGHAADDRRHAVRDLHRRDRLLRPELRLAGRQHRQQARLPALRRRGARASRLWCCSHSSGSSATTGSETA